MAVIIEKFSSEEHYDSILSELNDIDDEWENSTNILESQITKMNETVLPVYEKFCELYELQTNIDDTLQELDEALEHYNIIEKAKKLLQQNPGHRITDYIETFTKLEDAIVFFRNTRPDYVEVKRCKEVFEDGKICIERQLGNWLHQIDLLENYKEEYSESSCFEPDESYVSGNDHSDTNSTSGNENPLTSDEDRQNQLNQIYQGIARIIAWQENTNSKNYISAVSNHRKTIEASSVSNLGESLDRLEYILGLDSGENVGITDMAAKNACHGNSTSISCTMPRNDGKTGSKTGLKTGLTARIRSGSRKSISKSTDVLNSFKRTASLSGIRRSFKKKSKDGSSGSQFVAQDFARKPKNSKKNATFTPNKELVSTITECLDCFIIFLENFERILEEENNFIMKITMIPKMQLIRDNHPNSLLISSESFNSNLRGELMSGIVEAKYLPLIKQVVSTLFSCYRGISKSPKYIGTGLYDLLRLCNTYKVCHPKISRSLALTSDDIRRNIMSIGRLSEDLISHTGTEWLLIFKDHVDQKTSKTAFSTHKHGLTDSFFVTLRKCAKYSKHCGILQDDDCFKYTNEQKFSEFCKRGIGGLKACLERKALTKFGAVSPEAQCLFLFNNYSAVCRYLEGGNLLSLVKIQLPEVCTVFEFDREKYRKLYISHWNDFLKDTGHAKFVKRFGEKIDKSVDFRVSNSDDRQSLIEAIDGLVDGYLEDCPEKFLPKGFNYYDKLEKILLTD